MIRVGIFISQLTEGEAGRAVSDLSLHLSKQKECFVLVDKLLKADYPYGGELVSLESKNVLKKVYQLKQFKKDYALATMISFTTWPNLLNIYTRKKERVIISVRELLSFEQSGLLKEVELLLMKLYYPKADMIVVPLQGIKNELIEEFKLDESKIKVIHHPVNVTKIRNLADEKFDSAYKELYAHPVVITLGRLTKQKGQRQLIKAFRKMKEEVPGAKLLILGEGEMKQNLQQLVADLELEKDVVLGGMPENPYKYLAKAAVAVFPSLSEKYPFELCEAMACGVPVIASDCKAGPREILAPGTKFGQEMTEPEEARYGTLIPVCNEGISNFIEDLTKEEQILSQSLVKAVKEQEYYRKRTGQALERVQEFDQNITMNLWDKLV